MSVATKYERVNPNEEKLKRLYNCTRMTEDDQKYLNYQFERYKLRSFHSVALVGLTSFVLSTVPIIKKATSFKYWSAIIFSCFSMYKFLTMRNNIHFEQIITPYFQKYRIKWKHIWVNLGEINEKIWVLFEKNHIINKDVLHNKYVD